MITLGSGSPDKVTSCFFSSFWQKSTDTNYAALQSYVERTRRVFIA